MPKFYDVVIIGAGASGMCAAISIKQKNKELSVCVLEQMPRICKKLIVTGNGRCNITNSQIGLNRYHGEDKDFAQYALEHYSLEKTAAFFDKIGVSLCFDETGRAYPYSLQASSVVDAFRFSAQELGIEICNDIKVSALDCSNDGFLVKAEGESFKCTSLVVAAGLYSGGDKLGSNGSIFRMLKSLGYKASSVTPAIVQIKTDNKITKSLKGIKVNAKAALFADNKKLREEYGEVLFCDYGLSGPPIMQISRGVEKGKGDKHIILDLMPEYSSDKLACMLHDRIKNLSNRTLEEFLTGLLNKRLGQVVLKSLGYTLSLKVASLKNNDARKIAAAIKSFSFAVLGTTGFENSQVSAGGLKTNQFCDKTMMSKIHKNLYSIGEILDIDGDCGGFNLQWAWSSAMCAADSIVGKFEGRK